MDKVRLKTARVEVEEGFFRDHVYIRATLGSGKVVELCKMNPAMKTDHAIRLAQATVEAWRPL